MTSYRTRAAQIAEADFYFRQAMSQDPTRADTDERKHEEAEWAANVGRNNTRGPGHYGPNG